MPVLLQTGWQDLFLPQTLEQYERLSARGVDVGLTVGPWTHISMMTKGGRRVVTEALDWFAEHLGGSGIRARAAPVSVFVTGADQWRDLAGLAAADDRATCCTSSRAAASATNRRRRPSTVSFTYDPADPTPSIGGRLLDARAGGYKDDRALASGRRGRLHRRAALRAARRARRSRRSSWRTAATTRTRTSSCGSPR